MSMLPHGRISKRSMEDFLPCSSSHNHLPLTSYSQGLAAHSGVQNATVLPVCRTFAFSMLLQTSGHLVSGLYKDDIGKRRLLGLLAQICQTHPENLRWTTSLHMGTILSFISAELFFNHCAAFLQLAVLLRILRYYIVFPHSHRLWVREILGFAVASYHHIPSTDFHVKAHTLQSIDFFFFVKNGIKSLTCPQHH